MSNLDQINTVVIVMMENRSFDHMLGHLSLPAFGDRDEVEGLRGELDDDGFLISEEYMNTVDAEPYHPFLFEEDEPLPGDVPHDRDWIRLQMGDPGVTDEYPMKGFAEAYFRYQTTDRTQRALPLGFFRPEHVPITNFFAQEFLVCDHWFCSLPASTQPNKLIALAGDTTIDRTEARIADDLDLVIEWAEDRGVSWRVYVDYLSLFMLFDAGDLIDHPNFRPFEDLRRDVQQESPEEFPELVIIEPDYESVPHLPSSAPNDNHAPLPVRNGEQFLRRVYTDLTSNEDIWKGTVMVHTYDEHGGFWDHVSPPRVRYEPPPDAEFEEPFASLGPRVPAVIVSPLVERGSVFSGNLDHTSVLQFLAETFDPESNEYSKSVTSRLQQDDLHSLSEAINRTEVRPGIPDPPPAPADDPCTMEDLRKTVGFQPGSEDVEVEMRKRCERLMDERPEIVQKRCPELLRWREEEKPREPYDGQD